MLREPAGPVVAAEPAQNRARKSLARGGLTSVVLKAVSVPLTLAITVVLARTLGPDGYGVYALAFSIATILSIPVQVGLPNLVVREVARYDLAGDWARLRGLLMASNQAVLLLTALVTLGAVVVTYGFGVWSSAVQRLTFAWALLLIPLVALGSIRGAALRGLHRVIPGQVPELIVAPVLFLGLLSAAAAAGVLTPPAAMALNAASAFVAFVVGTWLLLRYLPEEIRSAVPRRDVRLWIRSAVPLSLLAGMHLVSGHLSILLLGSLSRTEEVGIFRIALQGATLVVFALPAINVVVAPSIARLYAAGDHRSLQDLLTRTAQWCFVLALPLAGLLIAGGGPIIELAFGEGYARAAAPLAVLCAGQLAAAFAGPVATAMNMTGYERTTVRAVAIGLVLNLAIGLWLIPLYGALGAAWAGAVGMVAWKALLIVSLWRSLGLRSIPL